MERAKVFGIGFHKTGTTSLKRALEILGYQTIHGDSPNNPPFGDKGVSLIKMIEAGNYHLPTIEKYDAFTDNPYFSIWKQLDANYPGSKFILTIRNEKDWINSCIRFFKDREVLPMREWMFGQHGNPASNPQAKAAWLEAYRKHNRQIIDHFKDRPEDLLILDITKLNEWQSLCHFLDLPIPKDKFPYENVSKLKVITKVRIKLGIVKRKLIHIGWQSTNLLVRRKTVYVIGHPKSGTTWLTVALARLMFLEFDIPEQEFTEERKLLVKGFRRLPNVIITHGESSFGIAERNGDFNPIGKKLIILSRDPRDVIVSYYYQRTLRKKKFSGSLDEFIYDGYTGIRKVVNYMNAIKDFDQQANSFLHITYEEMIRDLSKVLQTICQFSGITCSNENVQKAVKWTSFEQMKKREKNNFYDAKTSSLHTFDKSNPNSFKVRKGKIGGYKEELNDYQISFLNEYIKKNLSDFYEMYR